MSIPKSERVLRDPPPRSINLFTQVTTLCSGIFTQMGWMFFGFGMIFLLAFGMSTKMVFNTLLAGKWQETPGIVTLSEPTNGSVNEEVVYRFTFDYQTSRGSHTGKSYTTGNRYSIGSNVTVLYKTKNADISKIKGSRLSQFPFIAGIFVSIFPLIGLGFIIFGTNANRKALQLLQQGIFTRGRQLSKKVSNTTVNEQPVYNYEFGFEVDGRQHIAKCATHITAMVEDEEEEIILYHPNHPDYNVVFDAIASGPKIDEHGHLTSAPAGKALTLIAPGLVLLGYLLYVLLR